MDMKQLQNSFLRLDLKTQNYLLKAYCAYVDGFFDTHDQGSAPVTFFEWWTNDYEEMLEKHVKNDVVALFGAL